VLTAEVASRVRQRLTTRRSPSGYRPIPEHVAAVCYRVRGREIEFLLVQSRAGRWTFPKGRVENDLTRAAAAAREAVEEAGVHGLVDFHPFARYVHAKNPEWDSSPQAHMVDAHLCEVINVVSPQENYRNPTWFSAEKSKRRLHQKRLAAYGKELAKIVDRAMEHILRRHATRG
jgi:8-oxo-dGTP pyrophosphatase MutT (NUDIX family)